MATMKFTGNYNKSQNAVLVFAGKNDTPSITDNNAVFTLQVKWGTGGQTTTYSSNSGETGANSGIKIENGNVYIVHTSTDNDQLAKYTEASTKTIEVTGGWKNASDSESYLALPKQQVTRYPDNLYLNNKKGDIDLSIGTATGAGVTNTDLIFKFPDDFVGLESCEDIKLVTWREYSIPTSNSYSFSLVSNSELDAEYTDGVLSAKGKTGLLEYTYDIENTTYTGTFEIVDTVDNSAPAVTEWKNMNTSKHHIDDSAYNKFSYTDTTLFPQNKTKFWRIDVGTNFEIHGVGDFANYGTKNIKNDDNHTQTFSGDFDHTFYGCSNLTKSSVIQDLDFINITGLKGFMSGCSSFTKGYDIDNIGSNVTDLTGAFEYSSYNANAIKKWDVSKVTSVESLFEGTSYNKPGLNTWASNTSNITNFKNMFKNNTSFNQYIGGFTLNTEAEVSTEGMFYGAKNFNTGINSLNVSKVSSFKNMFKNAQTFNKPVNNLNTSSATNMEGMFNGAKSFDRSVWANPNTDKWNTTNVTNMKSMFKNSTFNQNIKSWETKNVETLESFLDGNTKFDKPLHELDTKKVTSFKNTFKDTAAFNQPLWKWGSNLADDVSLEGMFQGSVYNKPIKIWKVDGVTSIKNMFKENDTFNQELFPGWKLKGSKLTDATGFLDGATSLLSNTDTDVQSSVSKIGKTTPAVKGLAKIFGDNDGDIPDELKGDNYSSARTSYEASDEYTGGSGSGPSGPGGEDDDSSSQSLGSEEGIIQFDFEHNNDSTFTLRNFKLDFTANNNPLLELESTYSGGDGQPEHFVDWVSFDIVLLKESMTDSYSQIMENWVETFDSDTGEWTTREFVNKDVFTLLRIRPGNYTLTDYDDSSSINLYLGPAGNSTEDTAMGDPNGNWLYNYVFSGQDQTQNTYLTDLIAGAKDILKYEPTYVGPYGMSSLDSWKTTGSISNYLNNENLKVVYGINMEVWQTVREQTDDDPGVDSKFLYFDIGSQNGIPINQNPPDNNNT